VLIVSMTWFTTACVVIEDGEIGVTGSFGALRFRSSTPGSRGRSPSSPSWLHELEALAEAHTHHEAVSERLAAGRPADRQS